VVKCAYTGAQPIDDILKPDSPDSDPYKLLSYNEKISLFHANSEIEDENLVERIEHKILVLGLNQGTLKDNRRAYLKPKKRALNKNRTCFSLQGRCPWL
jgi:hypothetical protein